MLNKNFVDLKNDVVYFLAFKEIICLTGIIKRRLQRGRNILLPIKNIEKEKCIFKFCKYF